MTIQLVDTLNHSDLLGDPKLYLKIGDNDEFEVHDEIPELKFLGDTYTPIKTNTFQNFNGVDGSLFNYTSVDKNTITLKFRLDYNNYYDLKALRHKVYDLLMQKDIYRLRTDAEPFMVKFCYAVGFDIDPAVEGGNTALITLAMDNPSGYLFSLKTSDQQEDIWDDYPLGWHIPVFSPADFTFENTNTFQVYNPSSKVIDPYYNKDTLKFLFQFQGNSFKLTNQTNGSTYSLNKPSRYNNTIVVDGLATLIGSTVCTNYTDYDNIILDRGWNKFKVVGASAFSITFSFPFVYL